MVPALSTLLKPPCSWDGQKTLSAPRASEEPSSTPGSSQRIPHPLLGRRSRRQGKARAV